ncbi:hypothetical protein Lesp01_56760 [Lentzea sp. NBRC 102530]|nr:hypothetical protein Lesp01_56760 [Lentzea sp. NBRC 102530]
MLTYALTVLVAAVAIYGVSEFLTPVQTPKAGDCADVTGYSNEPDFDAVSCGSSSANYVVTGVVARSEGCQNAYGDMVTRRAQDPSIRICLAPLWEQGACYPTAFSRMELTTVDCGEGAFRVNRVSRDVPAPSCAVYEKRYSYPEVGLTYCTQAV